jgi:hypothetical protein
MPRAATVVRGLSNQKRTAGKKASRKADSTDLLQDLVRPPYLPGMDLHVALQCVYPVRHHGSDHTVDVDIQCIAISALRALTTPVLWDATCE